MPPLNRNQTMGFMPSLTSLSNLDTVTEQEDGSFAPYPPLRHADPTRKTSGCPTNYRESLSSFGAAAQGDTSVSSCDLAPSDPTNKKPDPRGVVDEPTAVFTVPKPAPKSPKSIQKSEFRGVPVCHSASLIMIKGKVAAEAVLFNSEPTPESHFLGRALLGPQSVLIPQPQKLKEYMSPRLLSGCSRSVLYLADVVIGINGNPKALVHGEEIIAASKPKGSPLEEGAHSVDASAPKHAPPSKSQRLKHRRTARRAHIADVGFLSEQIIKKKSAEPVVAQMWLWVILAMLQAAFSKGASGLSKACVLRKWLLRAAVMWMLVKATTASPIAAAAPPAPMPVIEFGAPGTPAWSGHRRLLSKVTAANWAELKTLCEAGGNEVTLSDSFDASSYSGEIDFSGKTCVVKGQGQTLDAKGAGRFFYGSGAGSSLEVHGLVLKNGHSGSVSSLCALPRFFLTFPPCPGAEHPTQ